MNTSTEMTKLQTIAARHSEITAAHGISEIRIRYGSAHGMRTIPMDYTFDGIFGFMNAEAMWLELERLPHDSLPRFVYTLSNTSTRNKAPCVFYVEFRLAMEELQEAA